MPSLLSPPKKALDGKCREMQNSLQKDRENLAQTA